MFKVNDIAEYLVMFINAFSKRFNISSVESYKYLHQYDAIRLIHQFYDVMHTQTFPDMVDSVAIYCRRKGGIL